MGGDNDYDDDKGSDGDVDDNSYGNSNEGYVDDDGWVETKDVVYVDGVYDNIGEDANDATLPSQPAVGKMEGVLHLFLKISPAVDEYRRVGR